GRRGEEGGGFGSAAGGPAGGGGRAKSLGLGRSRGGGRVGLGDDLYLVRYRPETRAVDFTLTLERARQVRDPGSNRPASFQSDVAVTPHAGGESRRQAIVMNSPLAQGPYKAHHASSRALVGPETRALLREGARPVSLSGLAVARDPGLWLKYAGSLLVVLGVAVMFYMKAYFFRRKT